MLLGACQMVDDSYNLETDNDFIRIMELLVADQSATLVLHNLRKSEDELLAEMLKGSRLGPTPDNAHVPQGQGEGCRETTLPSALCIAGRVVAMKNPPEELQEKSVWEICFTLSHCAAAMWRPCPRFAENQSSVMKEDGCFSHKILDGNPALPFMLKPGSDAR